MHTLICSLCYLLLLFIPVRSTMGLGDVDTILKQSLDNSCIIDSRQIKIPRYPKAYNPSLIPYKDGYLLSFRFTSRPPGAVKDNLRTDVSFVGLVRLDKNFNVFEETAQLLNIVSSSPKFSLSAEDARLFNVGSRIFIFFNDLPFSQIPTDFAMYFGELIEENGMFFLKEPAKLLNYPYAVEVEKNWSPFSSGDGLYVIYSDQPRIILEVDINTGHCSEVERTFLNWDWSLGAIRGGTPAYLVDGMFLTFFHSSFSSDNSQRGTYVMGAYTFDQDFPFSIQAMTPGPLGALSDYTQGNFRKVVFPGGLIIQDRLIHVAWGKDDRLIYITTFDKERLLSSMIPCSQ